MADETTKKAVIQIEADVKRADSQVDKFKKETEQQGVTVPVNIDLNSITKALHSIQGAVNKMEKSFDKDVKFSGLQKGLDSVLSKIESVTRTFNEGKANEFQAIKVDITGFKKLTDATDAIQSNIEALNDSKIDLSSFERLEETFKNIESLIHSIVKGMNFDAIRPSTQVQAEIESTTKKLEELAKTEEKINKLEKYLSNTGIREGKGIIEFGNSDDVNEGTLDNIIKKMKEYISLGGDLSKIQFKAFNVETQAKELYSLVDVLEVLEDEGKIDFIDDSQMSNDVVIIKTLRKELVELNKELQDAQIRENRDLNVSLDTKSVEDFSLAITKAVEKVGELHFDIPEGFKLDGLSTENLDKIIGKLDEIVSTIGRIGDLLSTGVDTTKLQKGLQDNLDNKSIDIYVKPNIDSATFATEIEKQIMDSNESVYINVKPMVDSISFVNSVEEQLNMFDAKAKIDVLPNVRKDESENTDFSIIDDSAIRETISKIDDGFADISKNFGDDLMQTVDDFKETLTSVEGIDYSNTFKPLRETLLDIVMQFQNSLENVGLSSTQLDEAYKMIKGWNDASNVIVGSGGKDSERSALIGKKSGKVSNSYLYDKEDEFSGKILDELNKLSAGVSGEISEIYDTWLHSHPFKKALEGLKTIGSDVGFSVDDFNIYMNKYLEKGITNMMVTSNGKYTNIDWTGIVDKKVIERVKDTLAKSDIYTNGKFKGSLVESKGVYDYDKQTDLINTEIIKAMETAGIKDASSRLTTGSIEDLKVDVTQLQSEITEAQNDAQILYEVLDKISNALNEINISGGFKFDGIDSLITSLEEVNRLLSEISASIKNEIPGTALSLPDQSSVLSGNQTLLSSDNKSASQIENQVTDSVVDSEKAKLKELENAVSLVIEEIDRKTQAFHNEKAAVDMIIPAEIATLEALEGELITIRELLEQISKVPIDISFKTDNLDESTQKVLNGIKESLAGINTSTLGNIGSVLEGFKISKSNVDNLQKLANAILTLKSNLNNVGSQGQQFLSDIKELIAQADGLKDLANVLNATKKELSEVTANVDKTKSSQNKFEIPKGWIKDVNKAWDEAIKENNQRTGQDVFDNYNNKFKSLNSSDGKIDEYRIQLGELEKILKRMNTLIPIDLSVNPNAKEELKKLSEQADTLVDDLENVKKYDLADQVDIDRLSGRISDTIHKNTAMPDNIKQGLKALRETLKQTNLSKEAVKNLEAQFVSLAAEMKATGKTGVSIGDKIKKKFGDVFAYFATYVSIQDFIQTVRQGYQYVADIDAKMIELEKVSDMSGSRLEQSFDHATEAAKDLGSTISDVVSATADWSRLGYDADAAEELAEVAILYKNVGDGIDIDTANNSLISTLQGFQMEANEAMKIVDSFNEVANRMPIDSAGIGEALQRSAASFNAANTDLNESIALITATNAVVQDPTRVGKNILPTIIVI